MKTILLSIIISISIFAQNVWTVRNSGTTQILNGVSFTNSTTGFVVGYGGTILRTQNGGINWVSQSSGVLGTLVNVDCRNENVATVVGVNGLILKTTDAGSSWVQQPSGTINELRSIEYINDSIGVIVGFGNTILRTTNSGNNWVSITNSATSGFFDVSFANSNIGIAVGGIGNIFRTTNGGLTWIDNSVSPDLILRSIALINENIGIAVGYNGKILRTTDGGATWVTKASGTSANLFEVSFIADYGFAVGASGTILKTTDGGITWETQNNPTVNTLYGLSYAGGLGVAVGTGGTILTTSLSRWLKNVNINDAGAQSDSITFGQATEATDSLDTVYGEYELPPVPPLGIFDARFNLPTIPAIGSLKDLRNYNDTSIVWTMTFQPSTSGYPITFDWSSGAFPALGNFFLRDYFGLVNVNMRTHSSYTLTNPAITSLKIEYTKTITRPVNMMQGWNILSVPLNILDMSANNLFPGATTYFFGYNNGYQIVNTLETSKGYWAKFGSSQTFQVTGNLVDPPDVIVNNDWNIIGPFDYDVPVDDITSTPPSIVATFFFGFNNGYQISDTLKVGKGYWVRANQSGTLHLNNLLMSTPLTDRLTVISLVETNFTITDGAGGTTLLKAGLDSLASDGLDPTLGECEIPPFPPAGVFDARFNLPSSTISTITDIRQGTFAGGFNRIHEIQYQVGAGTSITINYDFGTYTAYQVKARLQDIVTGTLIDTTVYGSGSYTVPNPGVFNKLKLTMIYGTPIPVELTSFTAASMDKDVNLQWSTASETNNSGYSIERKIKNENNWSAVTFVNGSGTTTELTNYTYTDKNVPSGIYNYRLKQIDFDGSYEYSNIIEVEVNVPKKFTLEQNYPNPFNPSTVINFEIPVQTNVLLKVYDLLGNEITTLVNEMKPVGSYKIEFDASSLSNGVYFYRMQAGDYVQTRKMIFMK